jgi:hypothetical protein
MSPQDSQLLTDFLSQLIQARGIQKDPEADALIQRALAQQPDAAYLLVQRALLLEQGMNNARSQIAALQEQLRGQQGGGGRFLDPNSWGNSGRAATPPAPQPQPQQYQPEYRQPYPPAYQAPYQPSYQQAGPGMGMGGGFLGGGLRGTLGSIATTAAGVAAGSFLFQGLENMFSHHGNGGNHLLNGGDQGSVPFSDQSGSSLADQAGLGDVGQSVDQPANGLFDSGADGGNLDSGNLDSGLDGGQGFFDGDGSDEGLFS